MNMKQSCKALICAIEGELDGRHCTEEQAAAILDHAVPSLTEALTRVEAERDSLMDTYVALAEKLGIDLESARKAPGKPSDVFVAYIQAERDTAQAQLAEAVGLLAYCASWCVNENAEIRAKEFLARHAQAEQQESQGAQAVDERSTAEQAYVDSAFDYSSAPIGSRDWALYWNGWQHRAALTTQPEDSQFPAAAAFVRNMATDYANEHGWDDMGGLSFGAGPQGMAKMEHFLFLEELAEKLRTMTTEGGARHA